MPQGATVLDFAYNIHTNVGNKAIGAKVNHKIESIFETLKNGDQIEIITSDNSRPNLEWLDHVTTAKAKQSITTYLKRSRENNIERGIELFDRRMEEFGITPSARVFRKILPAYECSNKDEFYSKLGSGIINLDGVDKVLRQNSMSKVLKFWDFPYLEAPCLFLPIVRFISIAKGSAAFCASSYVLVWAPTSINMHCLHKSRLYL